MVRKAETLLVYTNRVNTFCRVKKGYTRTNFYPSTRSFLLLPECWAKVRLSSAVLCRGGFAFFGIMDSKALTARKDGTFRGYMKQKTNFGKYLKERGYSTNTFSDKVGSSQSTIWRLSTGTFKLYNPDLVDKINLLCNTNFVEKDFRC